MSGTLVPPHSSSRRAALLEQLIVALTSPGGDAPGLPIRTRATDDPTIALLDAWATVGDVLGFYLDRIADEGYLATATQPGSILALARLVGYQPAPSLAAQVYLAYAMAPDPADGAVHFSQGLLFQSVPGPGQQPQTFESAGALVARPSWNLLTPKSTQPLQASTTSLVLAGTTANLSPNDMIVLDLADSSGAGASTPHPVFVASTTVDSTAKVTNVTLQAPAVARPALTAAPAPPPPPSATAAIDVLLAGGLGKTATPVPASANQLPRTAKSVFSADSDAVPRLISALRPAVDTTLYAALDKAVVGAPAVTGASVMRVKAAPFGAAAPPQPVFDASGHPAGTRDWPIGDTFTLELNCTGTDFTRLLEMAYHGVRESTPGWLQRFARPAAHATEDPVIDVQWGTAANTSQATIDVRPPLQANLPAVAGIGAVGLQGGTGTVTLSYAGYTAADDSPAVSPSTPPLQVTAGLTPHGDAVTFQLVDPGTGTSGTLTWDPYLGTRFSGQVGGTQLSITWATSPSPAGEATLTLSITTPLPLPPAQQQVLLLDGKYPGITSGSCVVIDTAGPDGVSHRVITQAKSADTVAASGYGITAKVTRLVLHDKWIDDSATMQTALRPLTVYAQPTALPLQPASVTADVTGSSIDLDGLVAGVEPGRLVAVTGTRTDLPAGATVTSGEIAMVGSVSAGADGGDTSYSTLHLAGPLAYSYQRATVQVYGNVVPAHQGATVSQVLGSGQPALAPQSFTLSSGPPLADPSGSGVQSSLTVTVNGVGYQQVDRVDGSTPTQSFLVGTNASGQTTITFTAPLPAGTGNVTATYRAGDGSKGNLQAGQISQLLTRPASLSSVTNPLPATGGSGGEDQESVRATAPAGLSGLGRAVTVNDYVSLAKSVPGVGKATAVLTPGAGLVVTVAGTSAVQLNPGDSPCPGVAAAVADPTLPVQVLPASLYLIALTADVVRDPLVSWDATVAAAQAALLAGFGYAQRDLDQDVAVSDLLAAAHTAAGVQSFKVTGLALVPTAASAAQLSTTLPTLLTSPVPAVATLAAVPSQWKLPPVTPAPAAVAFMSDKAPGTLILSEVSS